MTEEANEAAVALDIYRLRAYSLVFDLSVTPPTQTAKPHDPGAHALRSALTHNCIIGAISAWSSAGFSLEGCKWLV